MQPADFARPPDPRRRAGDGSVGAWSAWRKTHFHVSASVLYLVNTLVTTRAVARPRERPLPVAERQGALIVSNHRSSIDPLLIQLATDRVVHWLVARNT